MPKFLIFSILFGVFASCVPNKKLVYLQKGNELKEEVVLDSVQREYQLADYEYRIQPEDILSIRINSLTSDDYNVFSSNQTAISGGNQNLNISGYLVDKKGLIRLNEIGEISVVGLTLHEIEDKLRISVGTFVDQPIINIRLLNYRVTVLGEVRNQGVVSTFDNRFTLIEAIGQAGGLDELADRSKIKIIRQTDGISKVIYVNMLDEGLMNSEMFFTHQNDIVIVPPLKQRPFRRYFGQNLSLFVSTLSLLLLSINLLK